MIPLAHGIEPTDAFPHRNPSEATEVGKTSGRDHSVLQAAL